MFNAKPGTESALFEGCIKTLPDGGNGFKVVYPKISWQTYMTRITTAQAGEVAKQPFVQVVMRFVEFDSSSFNMERS